MTDGRDGASRDDDVETDAAGQPGESTPADGNRDDPETGSDAIDSTDPTPEKPNETNEPEQRPGTGSPTREQPALGEPKPGTVQTPAQQQGLDPETIQAYTTERRSLDATVQLQWGIRMAIGAVILGLITGAILNSLDVAPTFASVAIGFFLLVGSIWVALRYRVWVYQIREDSVYLERGVFTHVRTIVPYVRIQHVDTSRGPLERALGLSTLVVYTAGSRGADVSIPGLKPDEARDLQQRLKELAIEAEGDDAL